jgi:hypothetical protein
MVRRGAPATGAAAFRPAVLSMARLASVSISAVAAAPLTSFEAEHHDEDPTPIWVLAVASIALTLVGGVFAGLTIA